MIGGEVVVGLQTTEHTCWSLKVYLWRLFMEDYYYGNLVVRLV